MDSISSALTVGVDDIVLKRSATSEGSSNAASTVGSLFGIAPPGTGEECASCNSGGVKFQRYWTLNNAALIEVASSMGVGCIENQRSAIVAGCSC